MILAQITDPHVSTRDWAAADALARAVRAVLDLRPVPDGLLVSGDIADGSDDREYARAAELFGRLPMPVHVLPGNHDDPARLAADLGVTAAPFRAAAHATKSAPSTKLRLNTFRKSRIVWNNTTSVISG